MRPPSIYSTLPRFHLMNVRLSTLLDREFKRRATETGSQSSFKTLDEQAFFLGVTASWLSRLRNGRARLSIELSKQFADRLRGDREERKDLLHELQIAAEILEDNSPLRFKRVHEVEVDSGGALHSVQSFFEWLSTKKSAFVACEYRDHPRTHADGRYSPAAGDAGRAIFESDITFAFFQPFGPPEQYENLNENFYHCREVRNYLFRLTNYARNAFHRILAAALDAATDAGVKKDEDLLKICERIILYERNSRIYPTNFLSGLQSRIFFLKIPEPKLGEAPKQVFEWVACAGGRDFIFERDATSMPPEVVGDQFFPIVSFWEKHNRLPSAPDELKNAVKNSQQEFGAKLPDESWEIYRQPQPALAEWKQSKIKH